MPSSRRSPHTAGRESGEPSSISTSKTPPTRDGSTGRCREWSICPKYSTSTCRPSGWTMGSDEPSGHAARGAQRCHGRECLHVDGEQDGSGRVVGHHLAFATRHIRRRQPSDEELERRKRLYADPKVSRLIRERLSQSVGVVSFSADPLIPTMWAHYARNSDSSWATGQACSAIFGIDLRRVLYLELAPVYTPTRDNVIRIRFVDEERRRQDNEAGTARVRYTLDWP